MNLPVKDLHAHPGTKLVPEMCSEEWSDFLENVQTRGIKVPIEVLPDKQTVLDGRHRLKAAQKLGLEDIPARIVKLNGEDPGDYAVQAAIQRRHLTDDQRAALIVTWREQASKQAQSIAGRKAAKAKHHGKDREGCDEDNVSSSQKPTGGGRTREEAAKKAKVSARKVKYAINVKKDAPDLYKKVVAGKLTLLEARKEIRRRRMQLKKEKKRAQQPPAPKSPRLIHAKAEHLPLDSASVDIIITSPPYNLGSEQWPMGGSGRTQRKTGIGYKDKIPEKKYQELQVAALQELYRVARKGASLFYNHKVRQRKGEIIHPMDWLRSPQNPWTLRQEIIWDRMSTHNHCSSLFYPIDERIYWMTKGKPYIEKTIGQPSVWRSHGPTPNTWHPAPFTPELPRYCLKAVGFPGAVVLDPFGGSMTTCAVALELGFEAIGVDVNKKFITRAREEYGWTSKNRN